MWCVGMYPDCNFLLHPRHPWMAVSRLQILDHLPFRHQSRLPLDLGRGGTDGNLPVLGEGLKYTWKRQGLRKYM